MNRSLVEPGPFPSDDDQDRLVVEATLVRWWGELLGEQPGGIHSDFFQSGGRPEDASSLVDRIKRQWGVVIRPADLFEARTISKLTDLVRMKQSSREQLCIVPIRAGGSRLPLFLVHGVGGNILGFAGLARSLHKEQPVFGIQAQALNSEAPTLIRLEAMARFYVEELRRVQPVGPYAFLGFSFGGLVVYEMAQQLTETGACVRFLGMLDTWQPGHLKMAESAAQPRIRRMWNRMRLVRLNTKKLSVVQLAGYLLGRLKGRFLRIAFGRLARSGAVSLPESMRQVRDINLTAAERYVLRPYPGRITLFRAEDDANLPLPEDLNWRAYAGGGVEIIRLPGDHGQLLAEPNLSFMTRELDEHLAFQTAMSGEFEEFELSDDGLFDLRAKVGSHPAGTPLRMQEASSMPGEPVDRHGLSRQKVTE